MKHSKELAALLSIVDPSMVISVSKTGLIHIGGKPADPARLGNLKAEAEFFIQSDLWKLLNQTMRELAQKAMFVAGDSIEDMRKGRSMLYLLDSQQRNIDLLRSYQQR